MSRRPGRRTKRFAEGSDADQARLEAELDSKVPAFIVLLPRDGSILLRPGRIVRKALGFDREADLGLTIGNTAVLERYFCNLGLDFRH